MRIEDGIKEHLASAVSVVVNGTRAECQVHYDVASMITNNIDEENLVLAYKICLDTYEKYGENVLGYIAVIPQYVRQATSPEFFHKFRRLYNSQVLGLPNPPEITENYGCKEIEPNVIDISNKNKYQVLAALYNYATPMGLGFSAYDPTLWDEQIATVAFDHFGKVMSDGSVFFSWVQGRVLRCRFDGDLLYVHDYNHEHEDNLGQLAVSSVPNINEKEKPTQKVKKEQ